MDDTNEFPMQDPGTHLTLELRGTRFVIERETMMNLPESVLLCLFPNGLILTRQPRVPTMLDQDGEEDEEELYLVDFDPQCLSYVLSFFKTAQDEFYGTADHPGKYRPSSAYGTALYNYAMASNEGADAFTQGSISQIPLMNKQPIIVLREELEYFAIPPKKAAAAGQAAASEIDPEVFEGTEPSTGHPTPALLRLNGFDREDTWGFRALEPNRCCITSIALVLLKTGITHAGELEAEGLNPEAMASGEYHDATGRTSMLSNLKVDHQQFATAQKLLLFWRKPARKCWWDGIDIVLPASDKDSPAQADNAAQTQELNDAGLTANEAELLKSGKGRKVRVWARRVWTLELSLI
ncbi:phosphatase activator [Moesziomyces antarcticus]|uniref:Related to WHI2 - growth regulation protein n=2 Tax=Pseudozyma antarctica TaxID=84753 RepID=A0A5C3FJQ4_PSEA2|nr:phosphatase activator [Moesziomyces antarcticus]GAK64188.1 phosphatase activator [Moesziomyces antarcticus]SPO44588.1 related to WHI2 - growth regulation protein [Moesziomyces antarcticus]